jgi:hypothetical protein
MGNKEPISDENYVRSLLRRLRNSGLPLNAESCEMLFVNCEVAQGHMSFCTWV